MFALPRVLKNNLLIFFKGMGFLNPFKFKSVLAFIFIFSVSFMSAADTPPPKQIQKMNFTNVNIEDGLSDNDIRDMYQDNLGFVWFATAHGLSRYDGHQSTNYNHSLNEPDSISDNELNTIFQDKFERLWIGTANGLNRLNISQTKFVKYFHDSTDVNTLSSNIITSINHDTSGKIWIGTDNGINLWNGEVEEQFTRYTLKTKSHQHPISINSIIQFKDSILAATSNGIYIYNTGSDKFEHLQNAFDDELSNAEVVSAFLDSKQTVWLSLINGGVYSKKDDEIQFQRLDVFHNTKETSTPKNVVVSINEDNLGNIWLGTELTGLYVYDSEEDIVTSIRSSIKNQLVDFQNYAIQSITKDSSGLMWVSYGAFGVFKWNPNTLNIQHFNKSDLKSFDTFYSAAVWHFAEDLQGIIWIATKQGIKSYDPQTQKISQYQLKEATEDVEPEIFYLSVQGEHVWLASVNQLLRFTPGIGVTKRITTGNNKGLYLPDKANVYAVEYLDGSLYVALEDVGLFRLNLNTNKTSEIQLKGDSDASPHSTRPLSLKVTSDKSLWILTKDGLFNYSPKSERIRFAINGGEDKFSANRVSAMHEESPTSFWVGTSGNGINRLIIDDYDSGLYHVEQFNEINDLKYQIVNGLAMDDSTPPNIWISSHSGLYHFTPETKKVRQFKVADGLQAREFNESAYFKDVDGYLYFGGINGFNRIDPVKFSTNTYEPPLRITEFTSQCEEQNSACLDNIYSSDLNSSCTTDECQKSQHIDLNFPSDLQKLKISFASLDFTNPAENMYRYRLYTGKTIPWINLNHENTLLLTKLGSGDYTLEIQGTNHAGIWSSKTKHIEFSIAAPWYRHQLIYTFATFIILLSIYLIYTNRQIKLRAKKTIDRVIQKTEENFQQVLWGSGDELWEWNITADELNRTNPIILIDTSSEKYTGKMRDVIELVHIEDQEKLRELMLEHMKGAVSHFESFFRIKSKSGGYLWVLARAQVVERSDAGEALRLLGSIKDVTIVKATEDKLKLIAKAFENTMDGISILDPDFKAVLNNRAFYSITDLSTSESINKQYFFSEASHNHSKFQQIKITLLNFGEWEGEIWEKRRDGSKFAIELKIDTVKNEKGQISHYICIFSDITYRKKSEDDLRKLANIDSLTGLPNRSLFMDRLNHALAYAKRNKTKFALLFIDLDHFKNVNDTLGHSVGDEMLRKVGMRLSRCVRDVDTVARLGGDEFTIILENIHSADEVGICANKIIKRMKKSIDVSGTILKTSPSIGIGLYPDDGEDSETLLKNADLAMYSAKEEGRNNYQFFTTDMTSSAMERINVENKLRIALEENQLELFYQPKVYSVTGELTGFEALIRWFHPEDGMISPADFIPVAEETGLIIPMGDWILEEAISQAKLWSEINPDCCSIAINLSARQFQQENLSKIIKSLLDKYDLSSKYIELEITEGTLMSNMDHTIKTLNKLRSMGLSLSLDDFGTGYSSLSYLKRFPVNKIKVDQSFVRDITTDPGDASIVASIIHLSHNLGLNVIAEGCETLEQLSFICSYHCEEVQGYLFSKPLPKEEAELILRAGEIIVDRNIK